MMAFHDSSYPIQSTPKYINPNRICQLPDSFRTTSNLNRQKSLTNIAAPHKQPERSTREILNRIEDHWIQLPLPPPPPQMPQFARRNNVPRPPLNSRNVKPLPKNENRLLRRSATTNSVGGVYPLCTFDILTRKNLEFENKILQPQPPPQAPPPKPPKHLAAKIPPQLKNQQQQQPIIQRHQYETSRSAKSLSFHQPPDTTTPIYRQQQPLVNYPRMQNKSASSVLTSMNQSRFSNQNAIYSANRQIIINEKRARFKVDNNNQHYPPHLVNPHHLQMSPSLAEFRRQPSFDSPSSSFDRSNSRLQNTAAVDTNLNPPNKRFQPISTLIRTLPKWFFENELVKSHRYHMSKYHMY